MKEFNIKLTNDDIYWITDSLRSASNEYLRLSKDKELINILGENWSKGMIDKKVIVSNITDKIKEQVALQ